jgi:uncharacterized protein
MDRNEIVHLTRQYGSDWAVQHAQRILKMIDVVGEGLSLDHEALWLAAHLHDWGGYAQWTKPGMEHQIRSREVAAEFLAVRSCDADRLHRVCEIIENHHGGPACRCNESIVFTDADALDLLGAVGVARVFAMSHRDLRAGWQAVQRWRDMSVAAIRTPRGRQLAAERMEETNRFLAAFECQTGGMF